MGFHKRLRKTEKRAFRSFDRAKNGERATKMKRGVGRGNVSLFCETPTETIATRAWLMLQNLSYSSNLPY